MGGPASVAGGQARLEAAVLRRGGAGASSPRNACVAELGPAGQRAERALAEDTDAGGLPEQRRRIDRDAEPCGLGAPGRVEVAQVVIAPSMERMAPEM